MSKAIIALLILIAGINSQAGRFSDFCEQNFIADDPYQYDEIPIEKFIKMYRLEGALITLGKEKSNRRLRVYGARLRRMPYSAAIQQAISDYGYLEDK